MFAPYSYLDKNSGGTLGVKEKNSKYYLLIKNASFAMILVGILNPKEKEARIYIKSNSITYIRHISIIPVYHITVNPIVIHSMVK